MRFGGASSGPPFLPSIVSMAVKSKTCEDRGNRTNSARRVGVNQHSAIQAGTAAQQYVMPNPPPEVFLLQFAPETWSSLQKLLNFIGPPLPSDSNVRVGLRDCSQHLSKVDVFQRIAMKLRPALIEDRKELEEFGGTQNLNASEFAATHEAMLCSLYSAIDGLRTFLFGTYRRIQGVQNGSNGKLFQRASDRQYGAGFPEELRALLDQANTIWFPSFRELRTELTHGSTGSCHYRQESNTVLYTNNGIIRDGKSLWIENFESAVNRWHTGAANLIEAICEFHFRQLDPVITLHHCGMYHYRWYGRLVGPSPNVSFADGHCLSYDWFEVEREHFCPLANRCGAYLRKWPGGSKEFFNSQRVSSNASGHG
jgi:prepilin-type processing-associated H-X9-DG protein